MNDQLIPRVMILEIEELDTTYDAIMFACPGCAELNASDGVHLLPVNAWWKANSWHFNGNHFSPTLKPSIRTQTDDGVCHAYLTDGELLFLDDSTHSLAGQTVPLSELPEWLNDDYRDEGERND